MCYRAASPGRQWTITSILSLPSNLAAPNFVILSYDVQDRGGVRSPAGTSYSASTHIIHGGADNGANTHVAKIHEASAASLTT